MAHTFIKVRWKQRNPGDPIWLWSELDDNRWEIRKVEIYLDGSKGYASANEFAGNAYLGLVPVPPLPEISKDPEFEAVEVSKMEFDEVWTTRKTGL